ncbi:hypothetical protein Hanom_Chr12g01143701 [Helianthus anomalus]
MKSGHISLKSPCRFLCNLSPTGGKFNSEELRNPALSGAASRNPKQVREDNDEEEEVIWGDEEVTQRDKNGGQRRRRRR